MAAARLAVVRFRLHLLDPFRERTSVRRHGPGGGENVGEGGREGREGGEESSHLYLIVPPRNSGEWQDRRQIPWSSDRGPTRASKRRVDGPVKKLGPGGAELSKKPKYLYKIKLVMNRCAHAQSKDKLKGKPRNLLKRECHRRMQWMR